MSSNNSSNILGTTKNKNTNENILDILSIHNNILNLIRNEEKKITDKYLSITRSLFEQYHELINTPIKTSFIKPIKRANIQEDDLKLTIDKYLNIVQSLFADNDTVISFIRKQIKTETTNVTSCECGNNTSFIYKFNTYRICEECGLESDYVICTVENSTYADLQQINLNQRYKYEKICHFKDTVNQFQAKQNKHIPQKIYDDLEYMIAKHDLYVKNTTSRRQKYAKITRQHIRDFLHETANNKYYEDIQLLWSKITDNQPPNISDLEKPLYEDFERLVDTFLSIPNTNRKNFLNSQYVLKQLLRRYNYHVKDNELNMLKTPARLREHDEIYEKCCEILNWNFQPL
jgi:hypothetical protein